MKKSIYAKNLIYLCFSMIIFGTVGIFSRFAPLSGAALSLARSALGFVFVAAFALISRRKLDFKLGKRKYMFLIISGVCLGANWILFFEACRATTVATATLSYYFAPMFIILLSPFVFGERLTAVKIGAVIASLFGMFLISGLTGGAEGVSLIGIALGIAAAVLYAAVVIFNKKLGEVDAVFRTGCQFLVSCIVLLPYVLAFDNGTVGEINALGIASILIIGFAHTGLAYILYFSAAGVLPPESTALYSYIDPIVAVVFSSILLGEPITIWGIIGAVLILGSSMLSELYEMRKRKAMPSQTKGDAEKESECLDED